MYPYRIRLRGPWEAEPLDPPGEVRRVDMPARLGECGLGDCRRVLLRRRFGRPRRIDQHERLWLIGERLAGCGEFRVNGEWVGACSGGSFAFPVTPLIGDRNQLTVDLIAGGPDDGLAGDVALEIRCSAYLSDLRVEPVDGGRARISGEVCGEAECSLDVYVLAEGKVAAYRKCAAGQRFEVTSDESVSDSAQIRVELISGAVLWCAAEIPGR